MAGRLWPFRREPVGESPVFLGRRAGRPVIGGRAMETLHRRCAGLDVASEGDRGLPADRIRPEGSIGVGSVPDHDAGPCGAVGVAGRGQDDARGDGGDGRLLEACLARAVPRLRVSSGQRLAHSQRAGPQERRQRRDLDRRSLGAWPDPRQLRAAPADPGIARSDAHAARTRFWRVTAPKRAMSKKPQFSGGRPGGDRRSARLWSKRRSSSNGRST